MAQHGVLADGQYCGKRVSLPPQCRMAQGIDAAAHDDQAPMSHPMINAACTEPDCQQLLASDHPVLLRSQRLDGT